MESESTFEDETSKKSDGSEFFETKGKPRKTFSVPSGLELNQILTVCEHTMTTEFLVS